MEGVEQICVTLMAVLASVVAYVTPGAYNKVYLDDPTVCNMTLRLNDAMPAVLVRLSNGQLIRPIICSLQIEIGATGIAGLTAVVQELDVGKFEDRSNCTNYLQVTTYGRSSRYRQRLCDEWGSAVHHQKRGKSLFAGCDGHAASKHYDRSCAVRRINLLAHVPLPVVQVNGQPVALSPSFTVVVTAYHNEQVFGGCGSRRFLCADGRMERCIDERLVCDGRPNCGFVDSEDEYRSTCSRRRPGALSDSDHFFATWAGFAVIVLLLVVAVSYFIRSVRWTTAGTRQDVSSGSSIRSASRPVPPVPARPDAPQPPPYEALFPHGPPAGALEKKRQRPGEQPPPPATPRPPFSGDERQRRAGTAPPPPPVEETAPAARQHVGPVGSAGGAAVTHIYVEPSTSPEEPPPYTERPALRHSVLLAEAIVPPG